MMLFAVLRFILVAAMVAAVLAPPAVSAVGWYFTVRREFGSPWNWRVLVGPQAYAAWEEGQAP